MIVSNNDILWSASDLTRAAECEFSLLRQLDVKLGRIPAARIAVDLLMDRIAEIGLEHEARELARLSKGLAPYDAAMGRGVCIIDYPKPYSTAMPRSFFTKPFPPRFSTPSPAPKGLISTMVRVKNTSTYMATGYIRWVIKIPG